MGSCVPVHTPGVRSESRVLNEEPKLGPAEHKQYRTVVGKLKFLANERPDIQYCVKECARGVHSPSARDMRRAKRICRYLMGTRDWTLKLKPGREVDTLQMMVDSDWATHNVDRRSTSAELHSSVAAQSSLAVEHMDRRPCRRRKPKGTPSEVGHARDSSSVLLRKS